MSERRTWTEYNSGGNRTEKPAGKCAHVNNPWNSFERVSGKMERHDNGPENRQAE